MESIICFSIVHEGETRKRGIGQDAARGQEMAAESGDRRGDRAGTGGG